VEIHPLPGDVKPGFEILLNDVQRRHAPEFNGGQQIRTGQPVAYQLTERLHDFGAFDRDSEFAAIFGEMRRNYPIDILVVVTYLTQDHSSNKLTPVHTSDPALGKFRKYHTAAPASQTVEQQM
jgi:hypothetical protein